MRIGTFRIGPHGQTQQHGFLIIKTDTTETRVAIIKTEPAARQRLGFHGHHAKILGAVLREWGKLLYEHGAVLVKGTQMCFEFYPPLEGIRGQVVGFAELALEDDAGRLRLWERRSDQAPMWEIEIAHSNIGAALAAAGDAILYCAKGLPS